MNKFNLKNKIVRKAKTGDPNKSQQQQQEDKLAMLLFTQKRIFQPGKCRDMRNLHEVHWKTKPSSLKLLT